MEIPFEAPISEEDLRVIDDRQAIALTREKFEELVSYVEHLEGTLKFTDCEFQQERNFSHFSVEVLVQSLQMLVMVGLSEACSDAAGRWREAVSELYNSGSIRRESAEFLIDKLSAFVGKADAGRSA